MISVFTPLQDLKVCRINESADLKEHSVLLQLGSYFHSFGIISIQPCSLHCAHRGLGTQQ